MSCIIISLWPYNCTFPPFFDYHLYSLLRRTMHHISAQLDTLSKIRQQVEFYFSKENLAKDTYLVSKMNSMLFVPVSEIAQFKHLLRLTSDINTIIKAVENSDKVVLNSDKTMIKPNMEPPQRKTIIIRNVPSSATEDVCINSMISFILF